MKKSIAVAAGAVGRALAGFDTWSPAGEGEVRAPCPMLNTLANHGFLPHSGKGITERDTKDALYDALHINKTLGGFLFDFALSTNPDENATTFDLDHLGRHNVLEHDASLSRPDAYFGDVLAFNQSIFDQTKAFFTADRIDVAMAAKARLARMQDSIENNPEYSMSDLGMDFSFGESVAYIIVLGDLETGTADKEVVEFMFENEKLPLDLGWERPDHLLQAEDLDQYLQLIRNVTAELEGDSGEAPADEETEDGPGYAGRKARRARRARKIRILRGFHAGLNA